MPILRCPECEAVIAWRGKSLAVTCPNDHGAETWGGNGWHDDTRQLHVDRDAYRVNGEGIDLHLGGAARRDRAAEAFEDSMEAIRVNRAKGNRT